MSKRFGLLSNFKYRISWHTFQWSNKMFSLWKEFKQLQMKPSLVYLTRYFLAQRMLCIIQLLVAIALGLSPVLWNLQRAKEVVLPAPSVKMCCYNSLGRFNPQGYRELIYSHKSGILKTKGKQNPLRNQMCLADLVQDFQQCTINTANLRSRRNLSRNQIRYSTRNIILNVWKPGVFVPTPVVWPS